MAISTYQAGKLGVIGVEEERLEFSFHDVDQAMGIAVSRDAIALGSRREIHLLKAAQEVAPHISPAGTYDSAWLTRHSFRTGNIHGHELAFGRDGLWVVNTLFSSLCTLDENYSFVPRWRPPFISRLKANDRCHMNGLAMDDGKPKLVGNTGPGSPVARIVDPATGLETMRIDPLNSSFEGGVRTAAGDVNGDGTDDIIIAAGPGGGPRVQVFDGSTGNKLQDFFAYHSGFRGGVFVAAGDVDDDGDIDIITGADAGGGPHVRAFDATTLERTKISSRSGRRLRAVSQSQPVTSTTTATTTSSPRPGLVPQPACASSAVRTTGCYRASRPTTPSGMAGRMWRQATSTETAMQTSSRAPVPRVDLTSEPGAARTVAASPASSLTARAIGTASESPPVT